MINFPLPRIDTDERLRALLLPYSRFKNGDVWEDKISGHKIACLDCSDAESIRQLKGNKKCSIIYNYARTGGSTMKIHAALPLQFMAIFLQKVADKS